LRCLCRPAIAADRLESLGSGEVRIKVKCESKGWIRAIGVTPQLLLPYAERTRLRERLGNLDDVKR